LDALLARWRASLQLHLKYATLDDERYWHVQPWPRHERPQAWILNLANDKLAALDRTVKSRTQENDRAFLEALESMAFLANLIGLQNIERFVPLADPAAERRDVLRADRPAAKPSPPPREDHTRQMPALQPGKLGAMLLAQKVGVPYKAKTGKSVNSGRPPSARTPAGAVKAGAASTAKVAAPKPAPGSIEATVVDDVVRLIGWGREAHEVADLIASMSGRPGANAVRKIIKDYKVHIQRQLGVREALPR
jgi:hypothetical protein